MASRRHERTAARQGALQVLYTSEIKGVRPSDLLDSGLVLEDDGKSLSDYAIGLIGALAVLLVLTLARTPYAAAAAPPPDLKVEAFGWMWAWEFVVDGESRGPRIELPAGKLVEFAVSARDVNHGFGIYDPQGRLVAQTQAMPTSTRLYCTPRNCAPRRAARFIFSVTTATIAEASRANRFIP